MHESGRGYLRSAVLQHRTPLRPALLSNALPYDAGPRFAKSRHRSRFTIKTWPHVCQPFVVKAGNLQTLQILAFRILASPCNALHRHTIVLGSRLKPCPPPATLRGEAGEFQPNAPRFLAGPRNVLLCGAESRNAIVPGSRLKPGLVLRIAMPCLVTQFHAKSRHRSGFTTKTPPTISSPSR